jgi:hypothetical protein
MILLACVASFLIGAAFALSRWRPLGLGISLAGATGMFVLYWATWVNKGEVLRPTADDNPDVIVRINNFVANHEWIIPTVLGAGIIALLILLFIEVKRK